MVSTGGTFLILAGNCNSATAFQPDCVRRACVTVINIACLDALNRNPPCLYGALWTSKVSPMPFADLCLPFMTFTALPPDPFRASSNNVCWSQGPIFYRVPFS